MRLMTNATGSFLVVIPKQIVRSKGWEKGQELVVRLDGEKIVLYETENKNGNSKSKTES